MNRNLSRVQQGSQVSSQAVPKTTSKLLRAFALSAGLTVSIAAQFGQAQNQPIIQPSVPSIQTSAQQSPLVNSGASIRDITPPLVSIGSSVGWKIEPEDYRLYVPVAAAGRNAEVLLYSPDINLDDYANIRNRQTYYGDELYGKGAKLKTSFSLTDPNGTSIIKKEFGTSLKHATVPLFQGALQNGYHKIDVRSIGNGKNSFQIRSSAGVRFEASHFVSNLRGQYNTDQMIAFLDIGQAAIGKTIRLENYDADGLREMGLTLVAPNGLRRSLTLSENKVWAGDTITVSKENLGAWKIVGRVLPTTNQYSNSVAFRFSLNGEPLFARIPGFAVPQPKPTDTPKPEVKPEVKPEPTPIAKMGTLRVSGSASLCGTAQSFGTAFTINGKEFVAPYILKLAPGEYKLQPKTLEGASTTTVTVNVKADQTSEANLQYLLKPELTIEPQNLDLELGAQATVIARLRSSFPASVASSIGIELPEQLQTSAKTIFEGKVSPTRPLELRVPVRAIKAGSGSIRATLGANCAEVSASVKVANKAPEPAKLTLEKTVDRNLVKTGESVNFSLTVRNVGGSTAKDAILEDVLPDGLSGKNLLQTLTLQPGESKTVTVPATVKLETGEVINVATLKFADQNLSASAKVMVEAQVKPEPHQRRPQRQWARWS
jgi:uncharacterized repeat protein (TIGR01451 family)